MPELRDLMQTLHLVLSAPRLFATRKYFWNRTITEALKKKVGPHEGEWQGIPYYGQSGGL